MNLISLGIISLFSYAAFYVANGFSTPELADILTVATTALQMLLG